MYLGQDIQMHVLKKMIFTDSISTLNQIFYNLSGKNLVSKPTSQGEEASEEARRVDDER